MLLDPKQLKSGIHQVLKSSGLESSMDSTSATLTELLEANRLAPEDVISELGSMMRSAENEGNRLQALKLGLELNKLINNRAAEGPAGPVVNIVIKDFSGEINPILIPR